MRVLVSEGNVMRQVATTRALLFAAMTFVMAGGCTKASLTADDGLGSVALTVTLSGGPAVGTVAYQITGNGIMPRAGAIDTSTPGPTQASGRVAGIPAGPYVVSATATTSNSNVCTGTAQFTVVANQT